MEQLEGFRPEELTPHLEQLEQRRQQAVSRLRRTGAICALISLALVLLIAKFAADPILGVLGLIPGGAAYVIILGRTARAYRSEFKDKVIGRLVKVVGPELTYRKDDRISQPVYMASRIFLEQPDSYAGEDLVSGMLGQTAVQFSELHTQHRTERIDLKGRRRTVWRTIFRGIFFVADFNKHFHGVTVVLPDTAEKLFGRFGQMMQSWNLTRDQLVKLEDVAFEKRFVVYSTDQVEARYLLSPSLMERILSYGDRTGHQIYLSFVGSNLYVAISHTKNLFEPKLSVPVTDMKAIREFLDDLVLAVSLVEELNLNTRIWSKQA